MTTTTTQETQGTTPPLEIYRLEMVAEFRDLLQPGRYVILQPYEDGESGVAVVMEMDEGASNKDAAEALRALADSEKVERGHLRFIRVTSQEVDNA